MALAKADFARSWHGVGWERAGEGQEASGVGWSSEAEDGAADAPRGGGEAGDRENQHFMDEILTAEDGAHGRILEDVKGCCEEWSELNT